MLLQRKQFALNAENSILDHVVMLEELSVKKGGCFTKQSKIYI